MQRDEDPEVKQGPRGTRLVLGLSVNGQGEQGEGSGNSTGIKESQR